MNRTVKFISRYLLLIFLINQSYGKAIDKITEVPIDELLKAFRESNVKPHVEIEPLSSKGNVLQSKRMDFGQSKVKSALVPEPIMISSQPITINKTNQTGGKFFARLLDAIDSKKSKRQIMLQDGTQYFAAQGMSDGVAVQPGTGTQQQTVYYTQQQPQYLHQQPNMQQAVIYATPSPIQFHSVTPMPFGQSTPMYFSYTPVPYIPQQYRPQNKFYARTGEPIQPGTGDHSDSSSVNQPQVTIVTHSQAVLKEPQTEQKSVEAQDEKGKTPLQFNEQHAQQVLQQIVQEHSNQHIAQLQQQESIQHHPQIVQIHQQNVHPEQQVVVQQQPQYVQAHQTGASESENQVVQLQQQGQSLDSNQGQTILIPQGGSAIIQQTSDNEQKLPQIYHVQQPSGVQQVQTLFQSANGQTYVLSQNPSTLEERQSNGNQVYPSVPNNFVIKPHTYVTGPGGQAFTVPVPMPATEQDSSASEEDHDEPHRRPPQPMPPRRHHINREKERDDSPKQQHRPYVNSFMRRFMDAFSTRGDAMERVETNFALPVLASTGVFFGLGALAAGWYLSNANREVGILRRTGKPVPPGAPNVQRIRRQVPGAGSEVDQATFFQSIIQQAIEKQQNEFEVPEATQQSNYHRVPQSRNPARPPMSTRHDISDESHQSPANSKVSRQPVHHSPSWPSRQAINFAKVAIPAIVLGGAVIAIGALIFGWYISGSNREIAFLEPSAYSRRKRDLTTTALSDGWLQRLLSSIHENPFENGGVGKPANPMEAFLTPDSSKHSSLDYHANLSDAVVAVSLAIVAFFGLMGIVIAWFFAENEKSLHGIKGSYGFGGFPNNSYRKSRSRRSMNSNDLNADSLSHNPSFLDSILSNLEVSQSSILSKLQETGYAKWQETPCAKRIFCDVMSVQKDDTIRATEKRMRTFISMLPESLSSSLAKSLGEVMSAIQTKNCSLFSCGGHWVDSSVIDQPSPPAHQPRR